MFQTKPVADVCRVLTAKINAASEISWKGARYWDLLEVTRHDIFEKYSNVVCVLCLLMCWSGITSFVSQAGAAGFVGKGWLDLRHRSCVLFSRSFPLLFFFLDLFLFFPQLHFGSPCLLGDYPSTAGTKSICRAPNLLRCDVLKNKCCLNLQSFS